MNLEEELQALGIPSAQQPKVQPQLPAPTPVTDQVHPLAANWAKWRDRFAEAMQKDGFFTPEELERLIFSNQAQLWCGQNAAIVTQIQTYGAKRVLQATWMAGDLTEAIQMAPGIESFGRSMGCTSALIEGRPGWVRLLKGHGYKPWSMTVAKDF